MTIARLKLLVDLGVGKKVEEFLQSQGCNLKSVRAIDPKMKDSTILELAVREKRIVLTMDKDFGD